MSEPITGKVARILNSREMALNVGSEHGVEKGMCFDVMDPTGEEITDPDTGEVLGSVTRPLVRVRVIKVMEKLSVASTFKRTQVNEGGPGLGVGDTFARMLMPPKWITKYETLKTTEKTWEDLPESKSYVKTGYPVVQVIEKVDFEQGPVDG